jgi:hypothetical protein
MINFIFFIELKTFLHILFILVSFQLFAQNAKKELYAIKIKESLKIDGFLNEEIWKNAPKAVDFLEINPTEGKKPRFPTEVTILYDDFAIYVGAMMYDSAPDSILQQLGERDESLNADEFTVTFDTYDKKIDAFGFSVTASGVQGDFRFSDFSYNAVWHSHVKILENGWSVEMEIPFSALRFANGDSIEWNVQFEREIRRTRSQLQWSLVSKNFQNPINYWGKLKGLKNIKNPIRLQISPYLSGNFNQRKSQREYGYGGGADVKFGLSEAFTLDMTLLPDFSQVQSDNIVKNLSAFEVIFQEQRPFFQEGVDLFNLSGLFYSRRIGGLPVGYGSVYSKLDSNEVVKENPITSNLINVSKISGRTEKGTGIGILNAVTNESYATIEDTLNFTTRKVLTNPIVNYNIIAIDQNLKNNSSIYLINLNTTRAKGFRDANTTSIGTTLVDKTNSYSFFGTIKLTQNEDTFNTVNLFRNDNGKDGSNVFLQVAKIKGKFRALAFTENKSPNFNPNDLGVNFSTDFRLHYIELKYNEYNPFWILNQWYNTGSLKIEQNYTSNQILRKELYFNTFTTFSKTFHSIFMNIDTQLGDGIDQFESRVAGQPFVRPAYFYTQFGVSSDYRRKLAIDGFFGLGYAQKYFGPSYYNNARFAPIIRVSDKFTIRPSIDYLNHHGGVGFAGYSSTGNLLYGQRDIKTITNIISAKYLFKNNMSLTLRIRHYWSKGTYRYHGNLDEKGIIIRDNSIVENTDFNFNAFNTDLVFTWQVAPGSFLNIVYKNALVEDRNLVVNSYFKNLENVFEDNPLNTLTFKFIYFIDWATIAKKSVDKKR